MGFCRLLPPQTLPLIVCSSRLASANPNPSNSNLISQFLLHHCAFPQSRLAVLQKRHRLLWRRTSIEKAQKIVQIFRKYGFSDSQLQYLIVRNPRSLSFNDAESLENKLKIMESFGFTKEDIADVVSRGPSIIYAKDIGGNIRSLLSAFRNVESFLKAVQRRPLILAISPGRVERQIKCLRQAGLDDPTIFNVIYRCPTILQAKPAKLLRVIKYVRDTGVSEHSKMYQWAFICIVRGGCNVDQKAQILAEAGLSEAQIKEVFRKWPMSLSKSLKKIRSVMEYLVGVAGLSPDVIVKYPCLLGMSIEKRIKPRHEAFMYLSASARFSRLRSVGRFIQRGEKEFLKKFVEGNPDAEQLLKIYGSVSFANRKELDRS